MSTPEIATCKTTKLTTSYLMALSLIAVLSISAFKLKIEWADYIHKNREKAKMDIFKYIEIFYNPFAGKHDHKNKFDLLQN